MFKVVIWLAPVLAILFFYNTQKQDAQSDDMKESFAKSDEDFASMSGGLSTGDEKKYWQASQSEAHDRRISAKERATESNKKADDTFAAMENEMMNSNADEIIKEHK